MFALRRKAIFAAAFVLAACSAPAWSAEFSPSQKTEIEGIVRSYLLAHPEVLRDVSVELEKKQKAEEEQQRKQAMAGSHDELYNSKFQAVVGNPKGKVNLVEFFDYNCGYCKRALGDLNNLIKAEPELRVVLKDFPVLGQNSIDAAMVASAVRKLLPADKFWGYHQKLLLQKGSIGRDTALNVAREFGLDPAKVEKESNDPAIRAGLEDVLKLGESLNLTGTPSYILGDEAVIGAVGYAKLKAKIDELAK